MSINANELPRHASVAPVREPAGTPAEQLRRRKDAVHPSLRALPDYPVR